MAITITIKEKDKKHTVTLSEEPFIIGRSRKSNLKINDSQISGLHCSLKLDGGRVFISDLNSTNGTLLNNQKIKSAPLYLDDIVKIGRTILYLNKKDMTEEEIQHNSLNSQSAINHKLALQENTSSRIKKIKEARRIRASISAQKRGNLRRSIRPQKNKKAGKFAVITRILKIK